MASLLIGASTLIYSAALTDRDERIARLPETAARLSQLLDREIETTLARLVGLSTSPALLDDDLKNFHRQMTITPIPKGTVLAISDTTRQLANSMMPYGTALPELSAYTPQPLFFERLETEGKYISSRVYGPVAKVNAVTVSMKIPDDTGQMKYILTTAILSDRLAELMRAAGAATPGGRIILFDAMAQELAGFPGQGAELPIPEIAGAARLDGRGVLSNQAGRAVVVGYDRSAVTDWTVAATATEAWINAPVSHARRVLAVMFAIVLAIAAAIVIVLRNRVARPFGAMMEELGDARREIADLGNTLLVARTEEHRRIAQELHDTTAQKLVAADLHLQSMGRKVTASELERAQIPVIRGLLSQAMDELRTFSFLLRFDQQEGAGFKDALEALVKGFCDRADLACRTEFPEWLDRIDECTQTVLLRVTREALSNVYRHAKARSVFASASRDYSSYVLTIEDDGVGGISYPTVGTPRPCGLGISGMAAALAERGGQLQIAALPKGTRLVARAPRGVQHE
ncbi:hypothetical protein JWJ88_09755 [Paracoccus methylovorus]|uniref:Signal transduction histidine kinase subgroup 3 dimerisation and phosphoacceptor domain-containing protein n=1 Tax=Paracoccus methylovorus TaxID=2812658 RepID=A0ABX7JGM4_9RHOB|nr:hypothetical protein JWJ88_09755 [Paracoccus methylovorus]